MQTSPGQILQPIIGQLLWVVWGRTSGQYYYAGVSDGRHVLSKLPVEFGLNFESYESPIFFAEESQAQAFILHRFLSQIADQKPQVRASA